MIKVLNLDHEIQAPPVPLGRHSQNSLNELKKKQLRIVHKQVMRFHLRKSQDNITKTNYRDNDELTKVPLSGSGGDNKDPQQGEIDRKITRHEGMKLPIPSREAQSELERVVVGGRKTFRNISSSTRTRKRKDGEPPSPDESLMRTTHRNRTSEISQAPLQQLENARHNRNVAQLAFAIFFAFLLFCLVIYHLANYKPTPSHLQYLLPCDNNDYIGPVV